MDNSKVIYEKKFHHLSEEDSERLHNEVNTDFMAAAKKDPALFCKQLFESTVRAIMPDRVENSGFVIAMAKNAEYYEMDTVVTEYEDRLSAEYRINYDDTYSGLKQIVELSDDICFRCDNGNVILCITYYTQATYRSGRKIKPENDNIYSNKYRGR